MHQPATPCLGDLDDVHLAEGVGAVAVDGAAVLDSEHAGGHARELVVGNVDQRGERNAERQAVPGQDLARAAEVDEGVVGDDGASIGGQMRLEPLEERIEQRAAVGAARAPARQAAGNVAALHGEVRQVGHDQVEAAPGDGQPHVAEVELGRLAVAELGQQQHARGDGILFDIDAAKRGRAQLAQRRQHDTAA